MDIFSVHVVMIGVAILYCPVTTGHFDFLLLFYAPVALRPDSGSWTLLRWLRIHTQKYHCQWDSSGRVISLSKRTLTTHNTHKRQISMPPAGFEPTTPAGERPQTHALNHAATWTGNFHLLFFF
jgi:hypothetical protein